MRWTLGCLLAILGVRAWTQEPVWAEEFNSAGAPSASTWSYDLGAGGWGNGELQEYTAAENNVRVVDGIPGADGGALVITAREQVLKGKSRRGFTSARLRSQDRFHFKFGVLEARIQVPDLANGLWPAFWLLGNNFATVGWPASGELDIMEMGHRDAIADGVVNRRVGSAAHWDVSGSYGGYGRFAEAATDLDGGWHVFRIEWTPDFVETHVDGQWIWRMDIANPACECEEFQRPHFIILNMAVGGYYTGITSASAITASLPAEYKVDWIRLFANEHTVIGGAGGPTSVVVNSISAGIAGRKRLRATAELGLLDNLGDPVAGAQVTVQFTGSYHESVQVVTGPDGFARAESSSSGGDAPFSACVTAVASSLVYSGSGDCDAYP